MIMESPVNITSFNFDKSKVHSILKDNQGIYGWDSSKKEL